MKTCERCRGSFEPKHPHHRYCCYECSAGKPAPKKVPPRKFPLPEEVRDLFKARAEMHRAGVGHFPKGL